MAKRMRAYALTDKAHRYLELFVDRVPASVPVRTTLRGRCPVCEEFAPLTTAGRVTLHPRPDRSGWCTSLGSKPTEVMA